MCIEVVGYGLQVWRVWRASGFDGCGATAASASICMIHRWRFHFGGRCIGIWNPLKVGRRLSFGGRYDKLN